MLLFLSAMLAAEPPAERLQFDVVGLESNEGKVLCVLFDAADGYPMKPEKAVAKARSAIKDKEASCKFDDLEPGTYALSAFHDSNGNGELDTSFFGIPSEGLIASNDATGTFGPPDFEDAVLAYEGGHTRQKVRVRY